MPRHWDDGASFALGADYDVTDLVDRLGPGISLLDRLRGDDRYKFPDAPFDRQWWRYTLGLTYCWSAGSLG